MTVYVVREDATNVDFEDILMDVYEDPQKAMMAVKDSSDHWKSGWDEDKTFFAKISRFTEVAWGGQLVELYEEDIKEPLVTWKIYEMETVK